VLNDKAFTTNASSVTVMASSSTTTVGCQSGGRHRLGGGLEHGEAGEINQVCGEEIVWVAKSDLYLKNLLILPTMPGLIVGGAGSLGAGGFFH
jgi:hypothetical protein